MFSPLPLEYLSWEFSLIALISKMGITSYNSFEIQMISNTIDRYILTIETLNIRSEFFKYSKKGKEMDR